MEGLAFFLVPPRGASLLLVSREKEKVEPMLREKLKALPWLVSAWQRARHCNAKEKSASPTFLFTSESVILLKSPDDQTCFCAQCAVERSSEELLLEQMGNDLSIHPPNLVVPSLRPSHQDALYTRL